MIDTDESLLEQLREVPAHRAWDLFFKQYWQVILRYCRKVGLSAHEAEDVLQETMVALMRLLPKFGYDRQRRFRNYLFTLVHRKSLRAIERRSREAEWIGRMHHERQESALGCCPAPLGKPDEILEAKAIKVWRESLFEQALADLSADGSVEEQTLAIFRAYALEGQDASLVAARFGVTRNSVYQIRGRLVRRLRARVERLMRKIRL